ncbi:hypothetical protein L2E82_40132 [Cichorium intybus]|uniref:Uncharacterized protein n=1 Tax=Cichorium intybus TaxID=13427 RepID=A0ACB9AJE4_CICIN|nr:hypothetical protein L2E82_40132 [Cichorium intybus]
MKQKDQFSTKCERFIIENFRNTTAINAKQEAMVFSDPTTGLKKLDDKSKQTEESLRTVWLRFFNSNDADVDDIGNRDNFIARLSQQMENCMLEENDDSGVDENSPSKHSDFQKQNFQTYTCKGESLMAMEQFEAAVDSYSMALELDSSIVNSKSSKVIKTLFRFQTVGGRPRNEERNFRSATLA